LTEEEINNLAKEAQRKRNEFLRIQSQANDAQSVAKQTKREAERLRSQAEELEIQAVSALSMKDSQSSPGGGATMPSNGYEYGSTAMMTVKVENSSNSYGGGYETSVGGMGGFGGTSLGYNPAVMGQGSGISIPDPTVGPYDSY
jgi:hypothetical protein